MLAVENGSKEVNAAPRPAILPFVSFCRGAVGAVVGLVCRLTRADQDFGGGRGGAGLCGDVGVVEEDVGGGDFGDMSIRGNAGWTGSCGDVGVGKFDAGTWLTTSLFEITEVVDEAVVGRELFSFSANLAACFLCHRRLLGNGLLGSELHRPYHQHRIKLAESTCTGT